MPRQEPVLFGGNVFSNIAYGVDGATPEDTYTYVYIYIYIYIYKGVY